MAILGMLGSDARSRECRMSGRVRYPLDAVEAPGISRYIRNLLPQLCLHADPSDGRSPAIRPCDVIAIAVTALELADQHGPRNASP